MLSDLNRSLKIRLSNRGGCLLLMVSVNLHRNDIQSKQLRYKFLSVLCSSKGRESTVVVLF